MKTLSQSEKKGVVALCLVALASLASMAANHPPLDYLVLLAMIPGMIGAGLCISVRLPDTSGILKGGGGMIAGLVLVLVAHQVGAVVLSNPDAAPRQAQAEARDGSRVDGVTHERGAAQTDARAGDQRTQRPKYVVVLIHTKPVVLSDGTPRRVTRSLYVFCRSMTDATDVERSLKLGLQMHSWTVFSSIEEYENSVEYKRNLFSTLFTHTTRDLSYISFADSEGEECRLVCLNPPGADGLKVLRESLAEVRAIRNVSEVQLHVNN